MLLLVRQWRVLFTYRYELFVMKLYAFNSYIFPIFKTIDVRYNLYHFVEFLAVIKFYHIATLVPPLCDG